MNALLTARLAAWREVHARWPLFLIAPLLLVLTAPRKEEVRDAVGMFVLFVMLPPLTVYLAARPGAKADAFWRGLGGPAWASLAGSVGLHGAVLVTTALAAMPAWKGGLGGSAHPEVFALILAIPLAFLVLYATTAAARAFSGGGVVIAGVIVGVAVLVAGTVLSFSIWKWSPALTLLVRTLLLVVVSGALAVYGETFFGAWGGAVRRRATAVGMLAVALVLGVPLALDAADVGHVFRSRLFLNEVSSDGASAAYGSGGWGEEWWMSSRRAVQWTPGGSALVGPAGAWGVIVGPRGAVAMSVVHPDSLVDRSYTWMRTASGVERTCEGMAPVYQSAWRADGEALALRRMTAYRETPDPRVPERAILDADGCTGLAQDVVAVGWDRGRRVEITERDTLRVEGMASASIPPTEGGVYACSLHLGHVGDRLVVYRGSTVNDWRSTCPGYIAVLDQEGLRFLDFGKDIRWVSVVDDAVCGHAGDVVRCHEPDGDDWTTVVHPPQVGPSDVPAPGGAMLHWKEGRVTDATSGRSWPVPNPIVIRGREESWDYLFRGRVRIVDDRLRVFRDDRVEEVDAAVTATILATIP